MAELKVGEMAPDFSTTTDEGKPVKLSDFRGKRVILYFYPKDDTPGCTKQACGFTVARSVCCGAMGWASSGCAACMSSATTRPTIQAQRSRAARQGAAAFMQRRTARASRALDARTLDCCEVRCGFKWVIRHQFAIQACATQAIHAGQGREWEKSCGARPP